ncbi:MAG: DHHA1 domain-containing protein [bacterium]|nr:DHHA1 domain-containing protein [bacterium]
MKKDIVVIYHGECKDGFGGAFAAWKKFGNRARYIPYRHGDVPKTDFSGATVYFIDLCYSVPELKIVRENNERIVLIDHHKSNADKVGLVDESLYEMEHSGSVLAWTYFHPKVKMPKLLTYIEDTDLGRWSLPHTREVFSYIGAHPYEFNAWSRLAKTFEGAPSRKRAIAEGKLVLARETKIIQELAADAELVEFEGFRCFAANSPMLVTGIGTELVRRNPPISIVWAKRGGYYRVSLRSVGEVDVAKIAQKYGGGGHKNASGFTIPENTPFPWKAVNN